MLQRRHLDKGSKYLLHLDLVPMVLKAGELNHTDFYQLIFKADHKTYGLFFLYFSRDWY